MKEILLFAHYLSSVLNGMISIANHNSVIEKFTEIASIRRIIDCFVLDEMVKKQKQKDFVPPTSGNQQIYIMYDLPKDR